MMFLSSKYVMLFIKKLLTVYFISYFNIKQILSFESIKMDILKPNI